MYNPSLDSCAPHGQRKPPDARGGSKTSCESVEGENILFYIFKRFVYIIHALDVL